jgi:hypothetical protein
MRRRRGRTYGVPGIHRGQTVKECEEEGEGEVFSAHLEGNEKLRAVGAGALGRRVESSWILGWRNSDFGIRVADSG